MGASGAVVRAFRTSRAPTCEPTLDRLLKIDCVETMPLRLVVVPISLTFKTILERYQHEV